MYTTFFSILLPNFQSLFKVSGQLISLSHTYIRKRYVPGMARPFMFAALCQRAQPLKHLLAEYKKQPKNPRQPKNSLAGSVVSRGITEQHLHVNELLFVLRHSPGWTSKFGRLKLRSEKNTATDNALFEYGEGRNPRTRVVGERLPSSKLSDGLQSKISLAFISFQNMNIVKHSGVMTSFWIGVWEVPNSNLGQETYKTEKVCVVYCSNSIHLP